MKRREKQQEDTPGRANVYTISDLEQVKVLADPLRVRILEELARREATTKQVAERLGEKPTRLYHHVEALEKVGLVHRTRTRQNRGTVEKYYAAVARFFRTDPELFSGADADGDRGESLMSLISTVLDTTAGELRDLVRAGDGNAIEEKGLLSFVEIHASQEELDAIRKRLMTVLEEACERCEGDDAPGHDERRYRLTLAYFPLLDRSRSGGTGGEAP